jgi:glycosyltransferase involved in cell wall biosynthesis
MLQRNHICVCICTYQRPILLERLLSALQLQDTEGFFEFSVVIVDNDRSESARSIVESFARQSKISVCYDVEPEQNIALARNRALANSQGKFVAFIDDDEIPQESWLLRLYKGLIDYNCDGILAPVLPLFDQEPPAWVLKGNYFDRPSHPTGHVLAWINTRTGNALLKRELFRDDQMWFDPAFGSGGEDRDLFRRLIEKGHTFIWCNEAAVHETVPSNRWKRTVLLKRALLRGKMALNTPGTGVPSILKSIIAIVAYTTSLPLLAICGQHIFMQYLIKLCDHLGKVLAFFGINLVREKYVNN